MRPVKANESTAARRRIYFHLVDPDGITPVTGEAGGQPQISTNGGAWTNTGIGTLTAIGNGRYYADLTQAAVATAGDVIETRYKSATTAECPGDSVLVYTVDPATVAFIAQGNGTIQYVYTLTDSVTAGAIIGARITVTTDSAGTNIVAEDVTDTNGQAVFYLNAGTYYFWRQCAGYTFDDPDVEVVS